MFPFPLFIVYNDDHFDFGSMVFAKPLVNPVSHFVTVGYGGLLPPPPLLLPPPPAASPSRMAPLRGWVSLELSATETLATLPPM